VAHSFNVILPLGNGAWSEGSRCANGYSDFRLPLGLFALFGRITHRFVQDGPCMLGVSSASVGGFDLELHAGHDILRGSTVYRAARA